MEDGMADKNGMEEEIREGGMQTNEDSAMQSNEEFRTRLKKPTDLLKVVAPNCLYRFITSCAHAQSTVHNALHITIESVKLFLQ